MSEVCGAGPYDFIAGSAVGVMLLILALEGGATRNDARQYLLALMNQR